MIASLSSDSVTPLVFAMPRWARSCSVLPLVINAAQVIRLRSRGASSGRAHTSPNKTSSVSSTSFGAKSPMSCCARDGSWVGVLS